MPQRMLHVRKCRPGMIVARAIVSDEGETIADTHACLTNDTFTKLLNAGITNIIVDVDQRFETDLEWVDPAWVQTGLNALANRGVPPSERLPQLRKQAANDLSVANRSVAVTAMFAGRENVRRLVLGNVVSEYKPKVLAALVEIKLANPGLYVHALVTTVTAAVIGRAVGLPHHRLQQLIAGTLVQDLGDIYLPQDLADAERLRLHPLLGYRILRESEYVEALSATVALEHHEYTDGSGEPRGVIGQNALSASRWALPPLPTLVGEISAVANAYALKTAKGTGGMSPDRALAWLGDHAGTLYNKTVVSAFRQAVPIYPQGARVVIRGGARDGFRGTVSAVNPMHLDKPIVRIERDRRNMQIQPTQLDLAQDSASRIEVRAW